MYLIKTFYGRRIDLNQGNGLRRMIPTVQTRRHSARPCARKARQNLLPGGRLTDGLPEENMWSLTRIVGAQARVEHVMRRARGIQPRVEGFDRDLQIAPGPDILVHVHGVAPGNGEGPVARPVVADSLLQHPRLVDSRRLHEVARGLGTVLGGKYRRHHVEVVEGH